MSGKIIILNGTSSSGKSTVGIELKNFLHQYFFTSIDDFMRGLPDSMHGDADHHQAEEVGALTKFSEDRTRILDFTITPKGYPWLGRFVKGICAFCNKDNGVIFDMIITDDKMLHFVADHFREHEVHFVGIICDEETRKQREIGRGDRMHGMYLLNADYVYGACVYDFVVDTSALHPAAAAAEIKHKLETVTPGVFQKIAGNLQDSNL